MPINSAPEGWDIEIPRLAARQPIHSVPALTLKRWDGVESPIATEARVALAGNRLVAAFRCAHRQLHTNPSLPRDRSIWGLWHRDVVEVFVALESLDAVAAPVTHQRGYFEIEASPAGQWLALAFSSERQAEAVPWRPQVSVRAQVHAEETEVELSLPLADLGIPPDGPAFGMRLGLFRICGAQDSRLHLAQRPNGTPTPDFHRPQSWARARVTR